MTEGDAVFARDSAHIGRLEGLDDEGLTVKDGVHIFRFPRDKVAYEVESRVFLAVPNRYAARLWRVDIRPTCGLRGWWERRILGPSPKPLGGPLHD
jgi:hypothetical protein